MRICFDAGKTQFLLSMALSIPFDEDFNDPESQVSRDLITSLEKQLRDFLRIDPRLRNTFGVNLFKVKIPFT